MNNALQTTEKKESVKLERFNFEIQSLDQAMKYAELIADSELAPKDYKGKPGNVLVAIQLGLEIGLKPMQAIQNIAVINGRPCVYGDALIALVQSHPLCEYIKEWHEGDTAFCTVKRRGQDEYTYKFSMEDAKKAGLAGKAGVWQQYPARMLQMRARGFALRDKFADILKGIAVREEMMDYPVVQTQEEKKAAATNTVQHLIAAKNQSPVIFEDVCTMLSDATNIEELDKAAELAKKLPDNEKSKARAKYKTKFLEITGSSEVNAVTGEVVQPTNETSNQDEIPLYP